MAGQFVGATEAFGTAGEHASMRLFPGMGSNMSGLMFQPMKSFFTHRTFVRSGKILPSVIGDSVQQRWDPAHSRHGMGFLVLVVVMGLLVVMIVTVRVEVVVPVHVG